MSDAERPVRVLMMGGGTYVFLEPLAAHLAKIGNFTFEEIGLNPRGKPETGSIFKASYQFPNLDPRGIAGQMRAIRDLLFMRPPAKRISWMFRQPKHPFSHGWATDQKRALLMEWFTRHRARLLLNIAGEADIVNMHYLDPELADLVTWLPANIPVIISIWGSDLFKVSGEAWHTTQLSALNRADLITIQTLEMREILLTRFGRHLLPKVRLAQFGVALDLLDRTVRDRDSFLRAHEIDTGKIVICLGYAGSPAQRHVDILRELSCLDESYARRIAVFIPLTYGATDEYATEVERAAVRSGLDVRVVREYMSDDDVAQLRLCTDIMINAQETDALSGSMSESLYAGSVVVAGAWLPYEVLRRLSIRYHVIQKYEDVPQLVSSLIDRLPEEKSLAADNRNKIVQIASWECTIQSWMDIYKEVAGSRRCEKRDQEIESSHTSRRVGVAT